MTRAESRAAENRARGESQEQRGMSVPTLTYPWQRESFDAWRDGGRSGLAALSPGLPLGDLPYAVMADLLNASRSTNVLVAAAVGEADTIHGVLAERFGLSPSRLIDHHFLEPRQDGTLLVADLDELRTVDLASWGRFASTGLLVLLDADGVGSEFGRVLLDTPFSSRFCVSRQPSAMDLLVSRPWAPGFGPLVYRYTEAKARDVGVLPKVHYKLHVEMLRPSGRDEGPVGPWDPTDIPTRIPPAPVKPFSRGKSRDVAIARAKQDPELLVIHDGAPIREARTTVPMPELPSEYDPVPTGWLMADPSLGVRDFLRVATTAYKAAGGPGHVEDVVVLPVPADACRLPPWDEQWRATARQLDRVTVALLVAEDAGAAMYPEDLETVVGVALALRGIPSDDLHRISSVVADAAALAAEGAKVPPEKVLHAARAHGSLAAALLVAAEGGPATLLRLAHPAFTPTVPDLPHPSLYDARRHAWRGRAFQALATAARDDVVTAWGRYPELRFVFPSSLLLEAATAYCQAHRLKGPLDNAELKPITDRTRIAAGDRVAATATLTEWSDALQIAEEHERSFLADLHARQPERERRREGMALPALSVLSKDRDKVVLESRQGRFPATNISPGSEVALVETGDRKELGRGTVSRIDTRRITIEFEDGPPYRLPRQITVNLTFDAKVFDAYETAVRGAGRALTATAPVDDGPDGLLRAALLGEEPPERPIRQTVDVPNLTDSQRESIEAVLSGGRVRLIHGPPGTGKTHTLVHLAMALTRAGHSVLVTADSNAAVDNLAVGLRRSGALVVRVGHAPNIRDPQAEACRIDPLDAPRFVRWAAEQGIVVATTNYGAFRYLDRPGSTSPFVFDYVVHDEAGQSTAPSSLAAVLRGRRLVLAGDPLQLPPTVVSMDAKDAGLDVTLFERIEELTGRERTVLLRTQFRMKEPIVAFSNERFYEGRIDTHQSAAEQESLEEIPVAGFLHVTGKENPRERNGSISNDWEVEAVTYAIDQLRPALRERGWTLAVLTPYQAQREKLRRRLGDVEIATVDGAQGREWDVVLYSSVRSNPQHRLGFLADERRLNVAVTRARRNFLLVGDERTLRDSPDFAALLDTTQKIRMDYPHPQNAPTQGTPAAKQGRRRRKQRGDPQQDGGRPQGRGGQQGGRGPQRGGAGKQHGGRADSQQDGQDPGGDGPKRRRRRRRRGGRQDGDGPSTEEASSADGQPAKRRGPARGRRQSSDGEAGAEKPTRPRWARAQPDGADKKARPAQSEGTDKKARVAKPAMKPTAGQSTKRPTIGTDTRKTSSGSGSSQCRATTQAGSRCKLKARPGQPTCARHGG